MSGRALAALRAAGPWALAFGAAFLAIAALSGDRLLRQSEAPHFVYQAMAYLHGRLDVHVQLPNLNDWARDARGRFHVSFPPGPALLMLPAVAIAGYQLRDVLFTALFGAANLVLAFQLFESLSRAGESRRSSRENAALAGFLVFGTVHLSAAVRGEVWFTAHVVGLTCTLLFLRFARRLERPLLAGLAFGLGAITRTPLVFGALYVLGELLAPDGRLELPALRREAISRARTALAFGLPAAALLGFSAWQNHARFGDLFEFGHRHLFHNRINDDVARYGLFDLHYLPRNLEAALLTLPTLERAWPPRLGFDPNGMSVLVTTPLLAWLALPPAQPSRLRRLLAPAAVAVALPGLLYVNTGFVQFGYRFAIDVLPYLFVLLAVSGRPLSRLALAAGAVGVAVNLWGALAFS